MWLPGAIPSSTTFHSPREVHNLNLLFFYQLLLGFKMLAWPTSQTREVPWYRIVANNMSSTSADRKVVLKHGNPLERWFQDTGCWLNSGVLWFRRSGGRGGLRICISNKSQVLLLGGPRSRKIWTKRMVRDMKARAQVEPDRSPAKTARARKLLVSFSEQVVFRNRSSGSHCETCMYNRTNDLI